MTLLTPFGHSHEPVGPPSLTGPLVIGDDYVLPANWCGKVEMHSERIAGVQSDRTLTIDAWEQSRMEQHGYSLERTQPVFVFKRQGKKRFDAMDANHR